MGDGGCRSAGDLDDEDVARDPPALVDLRLRGSRDIVPDAHRPGLDAFGLGKLGGDVKIHVVAGVVAIDKHGAATAVSRLDRREDGIWRRRGENPAAGGGIRQVVPDQAVEERLVTAAAADHEGDLALRDFGPDDGAGPFDSTDAAVIGEHHAVDQLVDDVLGIVDDLLGPIHGWPPDSRLLYPES